MFKSLSRYKGVPRGSFFCTPRTTIMHYFYVLYSLKDHKLYKGFSSEPSKRFIQHCAGQVKLTKHRRPFVLIYLKDFSGKKEAQEYERYCKSLIGGAELKEELKRIKLLGPSGKLKC